MNQADVCLILEGTYPYVTGGVSGWAHGLIEDQSQLRFHLLAIVPRDADLDLKYNLPSNVVGLTTIRLQQLPEGGKINRRTAEDLHDRLQPALRSLTSEKRMGLDEMRQIIDALKSTNVSLGSGALLDNEEAWNHLLELYEEGFDDHSFLDYFWSYRAIAGGIYSILLADLPKAGVYHAMSTGYAGLMAARAKIETGRPVMLTEHGIYTNERRIEVISADWLEETSSKALTIDKPKRDLRDLWIDAINNFSHACYDASDAVITLFQGNQKFQLEDGASEDKMLIIPNGVNIPRYSALARPRSKTPTIALIGRVVPIKDVKTFIRACSMLRQYMPDLQAYIIGPTEEDPMYYEECQNMVELLNLQDTVAFTGMARVDDYLPEIDVLVLTSLSEAQPLVILEAGAAGIPIVATDVGACSELVYGHVNEEDEFGDGGVITPLASPASTADAVYRLLADEERYQAYSNAIRQRVARFYDEKMVQQHYRQLYSKYLGR